MQLTVRDAARILNVAEEVIFRWVAEDGLPAYRIGDVYRFNRTELLEWVTAHKGTRQITLSPEVFQQDPKRPPLRLADALEAGGIYHRVPGADREAAIRAIVERLPLPPRTDREYLVTVFLAREALGSTGLGDGIAIPHVRHPLLMNVPRPSVTLCFLERPVDYASADRQPVHALFTMLAPNSRTHLDLLSRLAAALQDAEFKAAVKNSRTADEILRAVRRLEGVA